MPSTLRRRLYCHYCGQRSKFQLTHKEGRKFKCESCEAVNFLDENGDIADVPPDETASPRQYARAASPTRAQATAQNSIFCSNCLKNQTLYTEALSQYFPESGDTGDALYDESLSSYKQKLEERYPQCCADCEPRVRQQLQQATYVAKSDHIRRMLERSRQRRVASRWGWRSIVVRLAGLSCASSVLAQLAWHSVSAFSGEGTFTGGEHTNDQLWQCLTGREVSPDCANRLGHAVGPALVLGLLSMWWNPMWQHKLMGNEGRLIGLQDYYTTQVVLLAIRLGSWILLYDLPEGSISMFQKAVHSVALVLESILALWSTFFIIRVDKTPPVNWQQDPAPLLSSNQFVPPSRGSSQVLSTPISQSEQPVSHQFSIGSLASATGSQQQIWRPPTPPDDDPDQMDLDHTPIQFQPVQKPFFIKSQQPTPFYGNLPAMPTTRRIHPTGALPEPKKAIGIPPGFFDRRNDFGAKQQGKPAGASFADPRIFPRDAKIDTGLENIFGMVFSLKEEPVEIRDVQMQDPPPLGTKATIFDLKPPPTTVPQPHGSKSGWSMTNVFALIMTPCLALSFLSLLVEEYLPDPFSDMRMGTNHFAVCVLGIHLALSLQQSGWGSRDSIALLAAASAFAALGMCKSPLGLISDRVHTQILAAFLGAMMYAELYLVFRNDNEQSEMKSADTFPHQLKPAEPLQPPPPMTNYPQATNDVPWGQSSPTWSVQNSQALSRPRTNSIESGDSSTSAATSSTASGWKTPKPTNARFFNQGQTPEYAGGFGRLALDDGPSGRSVAGPRNGGFRSGRR